MSQRRSRVPKFGSWDADNMHFSGEFESARKERGAVVGMNLNGQQENPEALMVGRVGPGSGIHFDSDKLESAEKHPAEGVGKNNSTLRSAVSSSGSDKSSPDDFSLQQRNFCRTRSDRRKSLTEINSFAPSSTGSGMLRSASNIPSDDKDTSNRSASVPKFGEWEVIDQSEGYTVIFNKMKEEKQNGATKFTVAPATPQPKKSANHQIKRTRSKMWCCMH